MPGEIPCRRRPDNTSQPKRPNRRGDRPANPAEDERCEKDVHRCRPGPERIKRQRDAPGGPALPGHLRDTRVWTAIMKAISAMQATAYQNSAVADWACGIGRSKLSANVGEAKTVARATISLRISGLPCEGAVNVGQGPCQAFGIGQQGEAAAPENACEPVLPVLVDDDAMQALPGIAGLAHGHVAVLDAVLALVVVQVVGLAVGQHDQQLARTWLLCKLCADMTDRGPEARIVAGAQRPDIGCDVRRHGGIEPLG